MAASLCCCGANACDVVRARVPGETAVICCVRGLYYCILMACLRAWSWSRVCVQFYIPQLVQALKYDGHDVSSTMVFLLVRAWQSPALLGMTLYWTLVVETSSPGPHQLRYRHMVETYLRYCGYVTFLFGI